MKSIFYEEIKMLEQKYSDEIHKLKQIAQKIKCVSSDCDPEQVVYYADVISNKVKFDKYQVAKYYPHTLFETKKAAKRYLKIFKIIGEMIDKEIENSITSSFDYFGNSPRPSLFKI
jgi:hypothetical protein